MCVCAGFNVRSMFAVGRSKLPGSDEQSVFEEVQLFHEAQLKEDRKG